MPVQPIDLQTVLLRLSQIGKDQAAQQNAAANTQAALGDHMARESQEMSRTVHETRSLEDGVDSVNDEEEGAGREEQGGQKKRKRGDGESDNVWKDPALGQNVDISG
jgi:hypothetical protein